MSLVSGRSTVFILFSVFKWACDVYLTVRNHVLCPWHFYVLTREFVLACSRQHLPRTHSLLRFLRKFLGPLKSCSIARLLNLTECWGQIMSDLLNAIMFRMLDDHWFFFLNHFLVVSSHGHDGHVFWHVLACWTARYRAMNRQDAGECWWLTWTSNRFARSYMGPNYWSGGFWGFARTLRTSFPWLKILIVCINSHRFEVGLNGSSPKWRCQVAATGNLRNKFHFDVKAAVVQVPCMLEQFHH